MEGGAKAFAIVGVAALTVRTATLDATPVGACALGTPLAWLFWGPGTSLVTTFVTVQLPAVAPVAAGMVRPLNVTRPVWPFAKLLLPAPTHVPPADCAPDTLIAASVSVNVAAVS